MQMSANILTDPQGNLIIRMEGDISYENSAPFRDELGLLIERNPALDIILDMQGVDFVGSSGIGQFVETIKVCNTPRVKVRLSNVKIEFLRVFKLYNLNDEEIKMILADFELDRDDAQEV